VVKSYNDIYIEARKALAAAGVEDAGAEARRLLSTAAEKSEAEFLRDLRLYPNEAYTERAGKWIKRRLDGEPSAYIARTWEFHGLELEIDPSVLIPRFDTEVVVDAAVSYLRTCPNARVLDLCTGSGCIGLCIAGIIPDCRVLLGDVDRRALNVAKRNAARLELNDRALGIQLDALRDPPPQLTGLDVLISNPPYIPTPEIETLDASVRDFEPWLALDGGEDGLDFYRSIFDRWLPTLKTGGLLALECGETQAAALLRLGKAAGLRNAATHEDTAGYLRAVTFVK